MNVATYGPGGRFTMTDRGQTALRREAGCIRIGPSAMRWTGDGLDIEIDEWGAPPMIAPVRGRISLRPLAVCTTEFQLSPDGAHIWRPIAPTARIEVALDAPGWQWTGHGYFDHNAGSRALEADFDYWTWGRFPTGNGTTCFYDASRRDGTTMPLAIRIAADGTATQVTPPPVARLPRSLWQVRRETRCDAGHAPRQVRAMLDAPFYCRSAVRTRIDGEDTVGVHEALDLRRFRWPFLKPMLAVRVPRRAHWPPGQ